MSEFHVHGEWTAFQSNGWHVDFEIEQDHSGPGVALPTFTANATQHDQENEHHSSGRGSGRVDGNQFHLEIDWAGNSFGVYNGTFDPNGFITGVTFDREHPGNVASWNSNTNFER